MMKFNYKRKKNPILASLGASSCTTCSVPGQAHGCGRGCQRGNANKKAVLIIFFSETVSMPYTTMPASSLFFSFLLKGSTEGWGTKLSCLLAEQINLSTSLCRCNFTPSSATSGTSRPTSAWLPLSLQAGLGTVPNVSHQFSSKAAPCSGRLSGSLIQQSGKLAARDRWSMMVN